MLESHDAPVACTYVFYRVGSRNETTGITGISHQLEHMMFKGTRSEFPTPGYIDLLIGRHGGVNNAETTTDYTDYYLLVPADQLDLALRIESDRMTQAAIDPKQLVAEKRVVLSELEGDENLNSGFLYDNMRSAAYVFHPYHYPVIGSKWDVQHFTRDQVYSYYRSHYCPNNAVLVIVGDFNTASTLNRVRALWKDVKSQTVPKTVVDPEPTQLGERRVVIRRAGNTAYLDLCYHIPSGKSDDMPALDVLSTILTTGWSSALYRALIETQMASSITSGANYGLDPELFEMLVTVQTGVPESSVESALLAQLEKMKTLPVDPHDLQKAKNQTRASFIFGQDGVQAKANRLGYFQVVTGTWRNIDTYLDRVNAVTAEDIMRVCTRYFGGDNRTVAVFEPNGEKADPSADAGAGSHSARYRKEGVGRILLTSPKLISADEGARVRHAEQHASIAAGPATVTTKLSNGLTLIVQENHANPTVTVAGFVRAGSINDSNGKYGVANLVAGMLMRGTSTRTSQEIADAIDFIGANISVTAHRESIGISASMLKENFAEVVNTLAECLRHPAFAENEVEKLRGETANAIQESDNDTAYRANQKLYELLYAGNPAFAHETSGTLDSIKTITAEDIRNYYSAAVRPESMTLVIVGDLNAGDIVAGVTGAFGDWRPEGTGFPPETSGSQAPTNGLKGSSSDSSQRVYSIVMKDKSQDDVAMGCVGISRKSRDFEAAELMNLVLGGDEFVGRVGKRVRDTEGLAYYSYTAFTPSLQPGPWVFRAGVNPANVARAISSAKDEISKMALHGVTQNELDWAKDNSIGMMQLSLETAGGIAAQLDNAAFFDLGLDYSKRYPGIIRSLSKPIVDAAATRYLHLDRLTTVIAGPAVPEVKNGPGASRK
jgi:zinc protease